jgi:hypothetical protein
MVQETPVARWMPACAWDLPDNLVFDAEPYMKLLQLILEWISNQNRQSNTILSPPKIVPEMLLIHLTTVPN